MPATRKDQALRGGRGHPRVLRGKTVADFFKHRNNVGIDVAVEALRDFSRKHRGGANELARFAHICRASRVMQPYLDAIA